MNKNSEIIKIKTPNGSGIIEHLWLSELGYLMLRVYLEDEKRWTSYNLGVYNPEDNIFTELIKNY